MGGPYLMMIWGWGESTTAPVFVPARASRYHLRSRERSVYSFLLALLGF